MENNSISVKTPLGVLKAKVSPDSEYPGIYISINAKEFVLVEYDQVKKELRTLTWSKENLDNEPENIIPYEKKE